MYAFVEMARMTDADIGLCLDGAVICGSPVRFRRPKNYVCPPG
jgi:hypothetical protein